MLSFVSVFKRPSSALMDGFAFLCGPPLRQDIYWRKFRETEPRNRHATSSENQSFFEGMEGYQHEFTCNVREVTASETCASERVRNTHLAKVLEDLLTNRISAPEKEKKSTFQAVCRQRHQKWISGVEFAPA